MDQQMQHALKDSVELKIFTDLRTSCVDEIILEIHKSEAMFRSRNAAENLIDVCAHKTVAIVRKYNRQWNELADKYPAMVKDGFTKIMKSDLLEMNISREVNSALAYL